MNARRFVEQNRAAWERLEGLLQRTRSPGLSSLTPEELRELGLLHRQVSADLAAARTHHADSRIVGYLNGLALRSHNAVYRAPKRKPRESTLLPFTHFLSDFRETEISDAN